jgi:hypothetical protein
MVNGVGCFCVRIFVHEIDPWPVGPSLSIPTGFILLDSFSAFFPGMSEIGDRAKTAPVKSRSFRDTGFPVSGKKFHLVPFKPLVSSSQELS